MLYYYIIYCLKDAEALLPGNHALGFVRDDVEPDRLGQGAALSDRYDVPLLHGEGGGAVHGDVLVALLESAVLLDVVQVIPPDDDGALHLGRYDEPLQDAAADRNVPREGALLVDVISFDGGIGRFDSETDVLEEPHRLLALVPDGALSSDEDRILLLVRLFVLVAFSVLACNFDHCDAWRIPRLLFCERVREKRKID